MSEANDHTAIAACIATYLDGLHEGNADKIASVFHPTSALTYEELGAIYVVPRDEMAARCPQSFVSACSAIAAS